MMREEQRSGGALDWAMRRLHVPVLGDASDHGRARLTLLFALTLLVGGPLHGAAYAALGFSEPALGAASTVLTMPLVILLLRRGHSPIRAAHGVVLGSYLALLLLTWQSGALDAPALSWLAIIPVLALMLVGKAASLTWLLVTMGTLGVFAGLSSLELSPPSPLAGETLKTLEFASSLSLVGLCLWLAWLYESDKAQLVVQMREAAAEVSEARDQTRLEHEEARLVLDHVAEGLLIVDATGMPAGQRSKAAETMIGAGRERPLWDLLREAEGDFADLLELGWEAVFEDLLPPEVTVPQLPTECSFAGRDLQFDYVPVYEEGRLHHILVVITDATLEHAQAQSEREHAQQLQILRGFMQDRTYFMQAYSELSELHEAVCDDNLALRVKMRALHTLKGNAGLFGLQDLAAHCHALEDELRQCEQIRLTPAQQAELTAAWGSAQRLVRPFLGERDEDLVTLSRQEHMELLDALDGHDAALVEQVSRWSWEPTSTHLARLADQARSLSKRRHGHTATVRVEGDAARYPWQELPGFWPATVHLIRNAIDHGIEPAEERVHAGKPSAGTLTLSAHAEQDWLELRFSDDGRGIDWSRIRERATEMGLPCRTERDLVEALFADGLSTRSQVSDLSGRGVGMAAVREACERLGGHVEVLSEAGQGTTFRFRLPMPRLLCEPEARKTA